MNKGIIIGIVVAVVAVAGGIYWFMQNNTSMPATPAPTAAPAANPTPTPITNQSTPQTPMTHNATIQNFAFSPSSITVKKGDTVTWTNNDSTDHTVTGNNGGPASATIGAGGTYSFKFDSVGTFPYHCSIHSSMTGTVIVTE